MPELKGRLKYCRDCAIPFITSACNRGRGDLRCPFGCREAHRRSESTRRSIEYYQTEEGKQKKAEQNGRRKSGNKEVKPVVVLHSEGEDDFEKYIQMVMCTIEKRAVTRAEAKDRIRQMDDELRQHLL